MTLQRDVKKLKISITQIETMQDKDKRSRLMLQFNQILKCQLLWIHGDYLHTLSYMLGAEGQRRMWLCWWLVWKDFTFWPTPSPQLSLEMNEWLSQAQRMGISRLTAQHWSHQETQEQNKALPPSRACFASTAGGTAGADGKLRDTVDLCYFTTHRYLDMIMLSTE